MPFLYSLSGQAGFFPFAPPDPFSSFMHHSRLAWKNCISGLLLGSVHGRHWKEESDRKIRVFITSDSVVLALLLH